MARINTAGLAAAAATAVVAVQVYQRWRSQPRNVAYKPRVWPIGHLCVVAKGMRGCRLHEQIKQDFDDLGEETMYWDLPMQPPLIITVDPANVEHILKGNFENYPKGSLFGPRMFDLLGDGIFNADGALWHSQRKTSSKMFTANKFKNHIWKVVDRNSAKVVKILCESGDSSIDMFNVLNRFTLDSIGEIGFGADIGSLEKPDSPFLQSFDRAQQIIMTRFVSPGWRMFRLLGLGMEWNTGKHIGALRDYSKKIVRDLRDGLDSDAGDSFVV